MVAILYKEPEAAAFAQLIHDADVCRMSVANYVELAMVVESQLGSEAMQQTQAFFRRAAIAIEPVTADTGNSPGTPFSILAEAAIRAGLNFGDCFSYALAKATGEPLLFKGNDFSQTDIEATLL